MFRWITIAILPCAALLAQSTTVSVQGAVTDASSKKPIGGAYITAIRSGLPPASQTVTSAADGSFRLDGLSSGTYTLCTQVAGGGYLNPCSWLPNPPTVTLTAGKPVTAVQLKLDAGAILGVRVNDPSAVLSKLGSASQAPPVTIGVRTPRGMFEPLSMRSADAGGSDHEVTIPFGKAVPVWMQSGKLTLTQADGTPVPAAGLSLSVTRDVAAGAKIPPLILQITGSKP